MQFYLYLNQSQSGPFSEEQILQMMRDGSANPDTLAWKEGMAGWERLATFPWVASNPVPMMPPPPPVRLTPAISEQETAPAKGSILGMISFVYSLISIIGWLVFFVIVGVMIGNKETLNQGDTAIVGLLGMAGIFFNLVALVLGIVGIFQGKAKLFSILGTSFNGLVLIGMVLLVIIGQIAKKDATYLKDSNTTAVDSNP